VPSTDDVDPEHAYQVSLGLDGSLGKGWRMEIGVYYKKMTGLLSYLEETKQPGLVETDPEYWEEFVSIGEGESSGAELGIFKSTEPLTGSFSYTYSRSTRTFEDLNDGTSFPFSFDRPHQFNLQLGYHLSKNIQVQAAAYFAEGRPITLQSIYGKFTALSNSFGDVEQITPVNGVRLSDYQRVDINLSMRFGQGTTRHSLNLGVYNLFNGHNEYYKYISAEDGSLRNERGLPLVPSFSYKVGF